ncbi:HD domain-containing phosphohydrolase [Candidatus Magnetominusculus dajiuhuensis]|uniref:HD domain-containing phosphohydrolase n=1 Tax=Candidatus Magnetominusculus dajiuhuensis TaxID=3137712 RepID=UPI003B42C13C
MSGIVISKSSEERYKPLNPFLVDCDKAEELDDFNAILKCIINYLKEQCNGSTSLDANHEALISRMVDYVDLQTRLKRRLLQIGIALSAEKNIDVLLEMIVSEAMDFTNADGGTLYIMSPDERSLLFKIIRNNSLNVKIGGLGGEPLNFPPVPLYNDNGAKNMQNVSAHVALTGETINFPDVYEAEGFNFKGTKEYDKNNGYRSSSMLVTPLRNHEREIIGVLQLINAGNSKGKVIAFSQDYQFLIESLASQAAIAITNSTLIGELSALWDSFIKVIATAIDQKSPYTGGHIRRVAELTMEIAGGLNNSEDEKWKGFSLTPDEQKELKTASWMHDIGKITTPEFVVDKATKLETIYDRVNTVNMRLEVLKRDVENEYLKKKLELVAAHSGSDQSALQKLDDEFSVRIAELDSDREFLKTTNIGGEFTSDDKIKRIQKIASYNIIVDGKPEPVLSGEEVMNLSIQRGTLSDQEREIIQNHVVMTYKMLSQLPWPKKMKNVPTYAGEHHEKLDGTGYPNGVSAERLSMQSRIMAISDIFEALSAGDRPYKPGKRLSECVRILAFMAKDGHVDKEVVDFFITSGILCQYAKRELKEYQLDNFTYNGKEYTCGEVNSHDVETV